ncbi:cytochrome P450 [Rubrobacter marinus]|uniref:Cytochrome P450 n=1 Tax=Rubrobacter marinus TaxID=2653852 RepID=A0A6G8Q226_9ACTN|nr:cytochrome P450 [Rubrobacter marinus]QIN80508.1 cytochrome P450 [Rubrobacter marinus]
MGSGYSGTATRPVPYLRGTFPFGCAREMRADPLGLLLRARADLGDLVKMHLGPYPIYMLFRPEHVEHVLQKNPANYLKDGYEHLEPMVGHGLISSEGELWRRQRRLIQPAFHKKRLDGMARTMTDATEATLDRWRERLRAGDDVLDANAEMSRLTLEIVGRALFGSALGGEASRGEEALSLVFRLGFDRAGRFLQIPFGVPTPKNLRYRRGIRDMDEIVRSMLEARRDAGPSNGEDPMGGDLLDMLLAAHETGNGEGISEKQLRDEVLTIMGAGYETTARTLCWTFYLLDRHPEAARGLRDELGHILGGRTPTVEDLPRLPYTRMVLQESMRLFPPVWGLSRRLKETDRVDGARIPRGNRVIISAYVTHRHPDLWPEPERFDPERFRDATLMDRPPRDMPRYAYFPFSGGPRGCVGVNFAAMEAALVLATVAQSFTLSVAPGHHIKPEPSFTLRPSNGLPVKLHEIA